MQQFDVTAEDGTTKYVDTLVFMDNGCVHDSSWESVTPDERGLISERRMISAQCATSLAVGNGPVTGLHQGHWNIANGLGKPPKLLSI